MWNCIGSLNIEINIEVERTLLEPKGNQYLVIIFVLYVKLVLMRQTISVFVLKGIEYFVALKGDIF